MNTMKILITGVSKLHKEETQKAARHLRFINHPEPKEREQCGASKWGRSPLFLIQSCELLLCLHFLKIIS